jgi:hypothetical protein
MDVAFHPRDQPLPSGISVHEGRDAYLAENGFTVEGYESKWTDASLFGVRFRVPNTARHRSAIMMHDLHHVATGYGTDLVGEGEVSAWELRRGLRGLGAYVGSIVIAGALAGLLAAPLRTLRAWHASSRKHGARDGAPGTGKHSLFQNSRPYDELLATSIGDLRRKLGVPDDGVADRPRRLHAYAPAQPAVALT